MRIIKHNIFIGVCVFLFFSSCVKDKPDEDHSTTTIDHGVYIVNEGNFQFGNASVSYYNESKNTVQEDLFQSANNKALGDVAQSMMVYNSKAYVVVNNSGKIEVLDPQTFVISATINGFNSPRFFLPVSTNKAYVSDYKSNSISIVNLNTNMISGSIPCSGWTEEMVFTAGKVFVCNKYRDKVYVLNTSTDQISDSIVVGYSSTSIRVDKNGKLWVLCGGDAQNNIPGTLYRIDPNTYNVEKTFPFQPSNYPWRMEMNGASDTLYYLNTGVYRMTISDSSLPTSALITEGNRNFYALGIHPNTSVVYVSDAMDYVQKSTIYRYTKDATLINTFKAGIISTDFYFTQ